MTGEEFAAFQKTLVDIGESRWEHEHESSRLRLSELEVDVFLEYGDSDLDDEAPYEGSFVVQTYTSNGNCTLWWPDIQTAKQAELAREFVASMQRANEALRKLRP